MSTLTMTTPTATRRPDAGPAGPSLGRLTRIELRKAVDTRAGLWLLIAIGIIAVGAAVLFPLVASTPNHTFAKTAETLEGLTAILLPIVGILLVTSEWSQRTALQTFTLVPRRNRVMAAKLMGGATLALLVGGLAVVLGAASTGLASHVAGASPWHGALSVIGLGLMYQVLSLLGGMALGLLLLNSPIAIVANFALPTVWSIVAAITSAIDGVQPWLNQSDAWSNLINGGMTASQWAQVATTVGIWIVLPVVAGMIRLQRREIA